MVPDCCSSLQPPSAAATSQPLPQREPRSSRRPQQERPPPMDRKPGPTLNARNAPDSYQIFVGGLPSGTTEQELRSVFGEYGTIIEVRTNPKNFGFIVFDNEQSVQKIMTQKEIEPFQIRRKTLNIEEKKPSEKRGGGGGGIGGMGSGAPPGGGRRGLPPSSVPGGSGSRGKGGKPPRRT